MKTNRNVFFLKKVSVKRKFKILACCTVINLLKGLAVFPCLNTTEKKKNINMGLGLDAFKTELKILKLEESYGK